MPSFDIVNEVDGQKLDNAINVATKEFSNRFDFHGSKTTLELDKKTMVLTLVTEDEMRVKAVQDIIISRMMKQGLESGSLDFGKEVYASGNMIKKEIKVKKPSAKTITEEEKHEEFKQQHRQKSHQLGHHWADHGNSEVKLQRGSNEF